MGTWFGYGWAQPVVSRRWAFITTILSFIKRVSHYRLCVSASHRAWERACGIDKI